MCQWTNSDISKFIHGSEAWGNKTKEIILRLSNDYTVNNAFLLFYSPKPRSQV